MTHPPAAVTFDFWDTLVRAPSVAETRMYRRQRLLRVLEETAASPDDEVLDAALASVRVTFDEHWVANEQFSGTQAVALLLDVLGLGAIARDDEAWTGRIIDAFTGVHEELIPPLTENVEPALRALRAHDVRIGIICDVGLSPSPVLRSYLERHGVLDLFDHWSFSDEVGVYKPDPVIFDHALVGLGGIAPHDAAHVGDLRRTDVAGARAFGMTAVRYTGSNDDTIPPGEGDASVAAGADADAHAPEAHHVIADHAELLTVLGFS